MWMDRLTYEQIERALTILEEMVGAEDGPCRFDHHGYCQQHGWFGEPGECGTREAQELLGLM